MVLVFVSLVSFSQAIACPFLKQAGSADSCCQKHKVPASPCPLSRTVSTCPFYITESKIGIAQRTPVVSGLFLDVICGRSIASPQEGDRRRQVDPPLNHSETYLRNRVLLI